MKLLCALPILFILSMVSSVVSQAEICACEPIQSCVQQQSNNLYHKLQKCSTKCAIKRSDKNDPSDCYRTRHETLVMLLNHEFTACLQLEANISMCTQPTNQHLRAKRFGGYCRSSSSSSSSSEEAAAPDIRRREQNLGRVKLPSEDLTDQQSQIERLRAALNSRKSSENPSGPQQSNASIVECVIQCENQHLSELKETPLLNQMKCSQNIGCTLWQPQTESEFVQVQSAMLSCTEQMYKKLNDEKLKCDQMQ